MAPKVSIIIPVYNAERFVLKAVQSALNQTYVNIEVIVVDDGSKDLSIEQLSTISDSRLRIFKQPNQGACAARNYGLREAKGQYVKFLDADDVLYPQAIACQLQAMETMDEHSVVFGDFDFIDENDHVFYNNHFDHTAYAATNQDLWFFFNWEMLISCPLHRKQLLDSLGGFDANLPWGQESFLHIALSFAGVKFVYHPAAIFAYRSHYSPDRISVNRSSKQCKPIESITYCSGRLLDLVYSKYGKQPSVFTTKISQQYFDAAVGYFSAARKQDGITCLQLALDTPHLSFPKYKKNSKLGQLYVAIGRCVGFVFETRMINRFVALFHKPKHKSSKLDMVLQPK